MLCVNSDEINEVVYLPEVADKLTVAVLGERVKFAMAVGVDLELPLLEWPYTLNVRYRGTENGCLRLKCRLKGIESTT